MTEMGECVSQCWDVACANPCTVSDCIRLLFQEHQWVSLTHQSTVTAPLPPPFLYLGIKVYFVIFIEKGLFPRPHTHTFIQPRFIPVLNLYDIWAL